MEIPTQNVESTQSDYAGLNEIQQAVQGQENLSQASLQEIRSKVTPGIKLAAIRRLRSAHQEGQSGVVLETIHLAKILGLGEKDPKDAEMLNTLSKLYPPSPQVPTLSRRKLLKNVARLAVVGGAAAIIPPAAFIGVDPEVRAAVQASLTRPHPPSIEDKFEQLSEATLSSAYERYFKAREHILSREAWMRYDPDAIGRSAAKLANIYYFSEKGRGETFNHYYERFLEELYEAAKIADLDFIVLVTSLQVTAENIGKLANYSADINTGLVQMAGLSMARRFGLQEQFVEQFMSYGLVRKVILPKIQESPLAVMSEPPKEGWNINGVCRIPAEVTTGMMDFEPSMRARALLLYGSSEAKKTFRDRYPEVVRSYQRILERLGIDFEPLLFSWPKPKETLAGTNAQLEKEALDYLEHFAKRLDAFVQNDSALAAIGITVPIDPWQKFNRTDIWYQLNRRREQHHEDERLNEPGAVAEFKTMIKDYFNSNRSHYYKTMMSQQILNPKFMQFLIDGATKDGNQVEIAQLQKIQKTIGSYNEQIKLTRTDFLETVTKESPLEFDSRFQTLASAVTTKMLSSLAGPFDPYSRDSLYWNVYRAIVNRELSQPFTLVEDHGFAPSVLVDPVYAIEPNLRYLDIFERMLLEKAILAVPANQDVFAMDRAIQAIRNNDFSAYGLLNLSREDKELLYQFGRYHIMENGDVGISRSHQVLEKVAI